jgi:hypothetical protein
MKIARLHSCILPFLNIQPVSQGKTPTRIMKLRAIKGKEKSP